MSDPNGLSQLAGKGARIEAQDRTGISLAMLTTIQMVLAIVSVVSFGEMGYSFWKSTDDQNEEEVLATGVEIGGILSLIGITLMIIETVEDSESYFNIEQFYEAGLVALAFLVQVTGFLQGFGSPGWCQSSRYRRKI